MSEPAAAPLAMASEAPPVVVSPPTRSYSLRRRTGESASASDALPAATPAMPPVHPLQQPPSEQSTAAIGSTAEATPSVAPLQYAPATDAQQSHPPLEHATTITLSSVAENGGSEAFISFPLMSSEQPHSALPRPPLDKEQTLHMHSLSRQETPLVHHATRSSPVADKGAAVPHAASSDADALLQELSSLHDSEPSDYVKTLSSDLNAAEASALFLALPSSNSNFKAFDAAELKSMSAVFSVLRIAAGERIITKGEEASFCGIVLSGSLNAVVSATLTVPLGAGEMVGEMALFEGGSRSADIVVGPSSECILAVITFAELDSMASPGAGENLVALQRKLLKMFACASIKKLRKTAQGSSTPSLLAPGDASSAAASRPNSAARPVDGTTAHDKPLTNRKSSVATPQQGATAAREGLYRARMALEQSKEAVNKAAAAEKAAQMQQEQYNLTARVSRYKLLSERLKTGLQAQVNQNQSLTQQLEETRAELERTSASLQSSFAEHDKVFAKYSAAQSAREAAEKALLNQRGSLQAERDRELAAVRAELGEVLSRRVDLELEIDRTRTESAAKIAAITERAVAVEATVADAQAKQQAARQQMEHAVAAQAKAEETAKRILNDNSMLQMQLTLAQVQLKEEIERNHTAQPWKARAADLQLLLESQKKHMMATISQLVAKAATLQHDLARFRQILLYVTASAFVKLYQVKKSARSLHLQISEMLVSVLEAHLLATGATAAAEGASGEGAGSAGIGGETGLQLLRKNLARKKRHYLDHIFRQSDGSGGSGSGSILTLIASLEDEVYKLRRPFEEVQERVGHWRRTSEAFCSRTVELTAEVVKLREQHVAHEQQQAHMQELLQRHNAEYSALLHSNTHLKQEASRLQQEVTLLKTQARAWEVSHDVVGTRKAEVENLDSRIKLQRAQLSYLQQRYVETAHALQEVAKSGLHEASTGTLRLIPPKGGPHYPPDPSASNTGGMHNSDSFVQLVAASDMHHQTGDEAPQSKPPILPRVPPPHEDPELHHSLSLQVFHQTEQQALARAELDKWRAVQFLLENQPEGTIPGRPHPSASTSPSRSRARLPDSAVAPSSPSVSVAALSASVSSLPEVSALVLRNNYDSIFSARNYTEQDPLFDPHDRLTRNTSRQPLHVSRTEEEEDEESKQAASPSQRIRVIKTNMGRSVALGDTSSLRSNNNYHSNTHSRNSTDIAQNGALHSVGASPANAIAGGAASPALIATAMSSYSSFAPSATTSEKAAPDYSRTLLLLKGAPATVATSGRKMRKSSSQSAGGTASDMATISARPVVEAEKGGTKDFEAVYAAAAPAANKRKKHGTGTPASRTPRAPVASLPSRADEQPASPSPRPDVPPSAIPPPSVPVAASPAFPPLPPSQPQRASAPSTARRPQAATPVSSRGTRPPFLMAAVADSLQSPPPPSSASPLPPVPGASPQAMGPLPPPVSFEQFQKMMEQQFNHRQQQRQERQAEQ